jgi:hypothetical protein
MTALDVPEVQSSDISQQIVIHDIFAQVSVDSNPLNISLTGHRSFSTVPVPAGRLPARLSALTIEEHSIFSRI